VLSGKSKRLLVKAEAKALNGNTLINIGDVYFLCDCYSCVPTTFCCYCYDHDHDHHHHHHHCRRLFEFHRHMHEIVTDVLQLTDIILTI
jgi:hypothetical protein